MSQEAQRESLYGRIVTHGEDPGMWPPCSEMVDGVVDGVRARENDPQCATDILGPRGSGTDERANRAGMDLTLRSHMTEKC
jgi:hypothetical protein